MTALPRPAGLVNGAAGEMHTQRQAATGPIMASSEGAAAREAQATATNLLLRLLTPNRDPRVALEDAAFEIGRLVGHGFLDKAEMADHLRAAAVKVVLADGEDAVQEVISSGFTVGERAAAEERVEEQE